MLSALESSKKMRGDSMKEIMITHGGVKECKKNLL